MTAEPAAIYRTSLSPGLHRLIAKLHSLSDAFELRAAPRHHGTFQAPFVQDRLVSPRRGVEGAERGDGSCRAMLFGLRVPRRRRVWLRLQAVADVPGPLEVELGDLARRVDRRGDGARAGAVDQAA